MAGEGGEHFGVRDMLEVSVVLADELVPEGGGNEDARREVCVLVDRKVVACGESVRV